MERETYRSDEAVADEDIEKLEALEGPVTDVYAIESVVAEVPDDEDVAVVFPTGHDANIHGDDVDGTDMEAIFEDEERIYANVEDEASRHRVTPPDLYELSERVHPEHRASS